MLDHLNPMQITILLILSVPIAVCVIAAVSGWAWDRMERGGDQPW